MSTIGWIGTAACFLGCLIVGQKSEWGFILGLVGNILWLIVGFVRDMPDLIVCSAGFAGVHLYNFFLWHQDAQEPTGRDVEYTLGPDDPLYADASDGLC